jgi:hypothetical protein
MCPTSKRRGFVNLLLTISNEHGGRASNYVLYSSSLMPPNKEQTAVLTWLGNAKRVEPTAVEQYTFQL